MKHENENMPDIDQERHERLCAYVFGELQGAERAEFEAELLRSPELQRERERLTATIGLVKKAVPDEGLSTAVRRDLVASARRSRFRFLSGRRLSLVAAAVIVVIGGVYALRAIGGRSNRVFIQDFSVGEASDKVARAPAPQELDRNTAQAEARLEVARADGQEALKGLGYIGDGGSSAPAAAAPAVPPEVLDQLEALGYSGGGGAQASAYKEQAAAVQLAAAAPSGATSIGLGRASIPERSTPERSTGHYGTGTPSAFVSRRAAAKSATAVVKAELSAVQEPGADSLGVEYRGPGDTTAPGASPGRAAVLEKVVVRAPVAVTGVIDVQDGQRVLDELGYGGDDSAGEERKDQASGQKRGREPMLTREQVTAQVEELLGAARVGPGESPSAMFFRYWGDAPFLPADENRTSTFAVDVDTASYALARSYLNNGRLPPREAVRTEEFVNYFKADQAPPADGKPFALGLELAPFPFTSDARSEMLRVTVRGKDVANFERQPLNLTFVIDNSGSMREGDRLELVKRALALLLRQLYAADSVAVVKFSNEAALVTPMLPVSRRGELESAIRALPIEGGTNVEAGLRKGYEHALANLGRNAVNRVVLCSDGVGNIGETSAKGLLELVKDARAQGIYLNTVGVGMGNHNDAFLEELADKGDGVCNYVDSDAEAKRVFVDGLASLVQPIARDVKIQVEFDPAQVESWRLLGYENRALREKDFRDDRIDAGEVNAGHQVTALYELVRRPSRSGPLATLRLRYKPPFAIDQGDEGARARADAEVALELERTLVGSDGLSGFAAASNGLQRAVLVAQFAEVLRQSVHARKDSLAMLLAESRRLAKALGDPDFAEFVALLEKANPLLDARAKQETPKVQELLDELALLHHRLALIERHRELARQAGEPEKAQDEKEADELVERETRAAIERLEAEVRDEIVRANGLQPTKEELQRLRDLGYAGDR